MKNKNNSMAENTEMHDETRLILAGRDPLANHGVVNPPVYHASTILYESIPAMRRLWQKAADPDNACTTYGRKGNPTALSFEEAVAELEGGHRAFATPSGLSAVTSALLSCLKTGDHLLMTDSCYGPSRAFCNGMLARMGIETTYYDPCSPDDVKAKIRPETRVVFTESPGSQTFEIQDIPAIAAIAHENGSLVLMDNTWASPLYYKSFAHGVDISIHAATKYMVGHSDALLGVIVATREAWPIIQKGCWELGQCAGPDDLYLAQRGLRTMAVRLAHHEKAALHMAEWLKQRPEVKRVLHPALPEDPGHEIWKRDYRGSTGLFGFILHEKYNRQSVENMIDSLELFGLGYSWGGYESLLIPCDPAAGRTAVPWTEKGHLLRIYVGLEAVEDLQGDLERAFALLEE